MISRIEALADAWIEYGTRFSDPNSEEYLCRNPGALKWFPTQKLHAKTESGMRKFRSFIDGYQALCFDFEVKCKGESRSRVTKEATLTDLVIAFSVPETTAKYMARFLRKALNDQNISEKTRLSYFLESVAQDQPCPMAT